MQGVTAPTPSAFSHPQPLRAPPGGICDDCLKVKPKVSSSPQKGEEKTHCLFLSQEHH